MLVLPGGEGFRARRWWPRRPEGNLVDLSVAVYLAATAALLVGPLQGTPGAGPRLAAHLAGLVLILAVRRVLASTPPDRLPLLRLAHAWYPVVLVSLLYRGTDLFGQGLHGRCYDAEVMGWEEALFGTSPALWLCEVAPWRSLSEFLHLCYMVYWVSTAGLALRLLLAGRERDFQAFLFTATNAYLACCLCYIAFPVAGPRELWPPLPAELQGPLYALCHFVVGRGAALGAAFPSGHVALAVLLTLDLRRRDRQAFPLVALWAAGCVVATVYGRFHYAVDALAGVAAALVVWRWLGQGTYDRLTGWAPARGDR